MAHNTKQLLANYSRVSVRDIDVGKLAGRYLPIVAQRKAQDLANEQEYRLNIPQLERTKRLVAEELEQLVREENSHLPVTSVFDALQAVKAHKDAERDAGLRAIRGQLEKMWRKDRTASISVATYEALADHYKKNYPRSAVVDVLKKIGQDGYMTLEVSKLASIASEVNSQADYEEAVLRNGLQGNSPNNVKARQFILALVNGEVDRSFERTAQSFGTKRVPYSFFVYLGDNMFEENAREDGWEVNDPAEMDALTDAAQKVEDNVLAWLNKYVGDTHSEGYNTRNELSGLIYVDSGSDGQKFIESVIEGGEPVSEGKGDLPFDATEEVEDKYARLFNVYLDFMREGVESEDLTDEKEAKKAQSFVDHGQYLTLEEKKGGLVLTPTEEGKEFAQELIDNGKNVENFGIYDMLEDFFGNGWESLNPEEVGALTEGALIAQDVERDEDGNFVDVGTIYWDSNYMVQDCVAEWAKGNSVTWVGDSGSKEAKKAQSDEPEEEFSGPDEGDYTISSGGRLGTDYIIGVVGEKTLGKASEWDDVVNIIADDMEKNKFWPNVWFISDHGNADLVNFPMEESASGKRAQSDEPEDEEPEEEFDSEWGKFDSPLAKKLWEASLESGQDEELGSTTEAPGTWVALFKPEKAILYADTQGFISVDEFDDEESLIRHWQKLEKDLAVEDAFDDVE
jgi:hypothetical protein